MAFTPNAVVLEGFPFGIFTFTYQLSGVASTDAAVAATVGKAVSQDTTLPGTVKLAGAGDRIFGRVYQGENRQIDGLVVASVARKFKERLPAASGHTIGLGASVEGAGDGLVQAAAAYNGTEVIATGDDYVIVEML